MASALCPQNSSLAFLISILASFSALMAARIFGCRSCADSIETADRHRTKTNAADIDLKSLLMLSPQFLLFVIFNKRTENLSLKVSCKFQTVLADEPIHTTARIPIILYVNT